MSSLATPKPHSRRYQTTGYVYNYFFTFLIVWPYICLWYYFKNLEWWRDRGRDLREKGRTFDLVNQSQALHSWEVVLLERAVGFLAFTTPLGFYNLCVYVCVRGRGEGEGGGRFVHSIMTTT